MNDEEFRNSCREICYETMESFRRNNLKKPIIRFEEQANVLEAVAQLYIAANVPSPYESNENDESNTKPCKYCDHSEPRISGKAPYHYIYIDSSKKELVDVTDGNRVRKISRVGIRYCPFCRRKL